MIFAVSKCMPTLARRASGKKNERRKKNDRAVAPDGKSIMLDKAASPAIGEVCPAATDPTGGLRKARRHDP
jgi:hypothetical protein